MRGGMGGWRPDIGSVEILSKEIGSTRAGRPGLKSRTAHFYRRRAARVVRCRSSGSAVATCA